MGLQKCKTLKKNRLGTLDISATSTNLWVSMFPSFMFFFQSFSRINMMCSCSRHSKRGWIRIVKSQRLVWIRNSMVSGLNGHKQNKMAAISLSSHCARSLCIFSSQKLRCFCTQGDSRTTHVPVMLKECLSFLAPRDGQVGRTFYPSFVYQSLPVAVFLSSGCI